MIIERMKYSLSPHWKMCISSTQLCATQATPCSNHIQMPPIPTYFLECYKYRVISSASANFISSPYMLFKLFI